MSKGWFNPEALSCADVDGQHLVGSRREVVGMLPYDEFKLQTRTRMRPQSYTGNTLWRKGFMPSPLMTFAVVIFIVLTLTQILVIHTSGKISVRNYQRKSNEAFNVESLLNRDVPSIDMSRKLMQNEIYAVKIQRLFREASSLVRTTPPSDITFDESGAYEINQKQNSRHNSSSIFYPLQKGKLKSDTVTISPNSTDSKYRQEKLPRCPEVPPNLEGHLNIDLTPGKHHHTQQSILEDNPGVLPGGTGHPSHCRARTLR